MDSGTIDTGTIGTMDSGTIETIRSRTIETIDSGTIETIESGTIGTGKAKKDLTRLRPECCSMSVKPPRTEPGIDRNTLASQFCH